ncbi:MAG: hypothetical protein C0518_04730 [Opitutus sp.]|nr:hypothetical protein [Opitutus sp.]
MNRDGRSPLSSTQRASIIAHFKEVAQELAQFQIEFPHAPQSKLAAVEEARGLLRAGFLGDAESQKAGISLVERLRLDPEIPDETRFQLEAVAEQVLVRTVAKTQGEAVAARENSARYLMSRYPNQSGGYELLLSVVDTSDDDFKIREAVREVLGSNAPFAAKAKATILQERLALVGKSLADVANTAHGRNGFFEKYRSERVLLYTWATWSRPSVEFAQKLRAAQFGGARLVGFNLDEDVAAAKALAESERLPGDQYFDQASVRGRLALLLKLDRTGRVYFTNAAGVFIDVAAERGKSAQRGQEEGRP